MKKILTLMILALLGMTQLAAQTGVSEPFATTGLKAINPEVGFNDMSAGTMGALAAAAPRYEEGESADPHMSGKWLVLIDKDNEERWYKMNPPLDDYGEDNYSIGMTLPLNPWNEDVPFYFMVDGLRYGAETDMQVPVFSDYLVDNQNPLVLSENRFCVPANFTYFFGIVIDGESIYMLIVCEHIHHSVESVFADQVLPADGNYYNLMGQPVGTEVPSVPGIYIHQGKKIIVR